MIIFRDYSHYNCYVDVNKNRELYEGNVVTAAGSDPDRTFHAPVVSFRLIFFDGLYVCHSQSRPDAHAD